MALALVTAPTIEPVTLAEAKAHLRITVDDENGLIQTLIGAARQYVETATHRALLQQTWDDKRDAFPCGDIVLPLAPVTSVTSVSYVDQNGDTQVWSSALYDTDLPVGPQAAKARITPGYGEIYPITRAEINAVTIRFVAGYGTTAATVPASLRAAIKGLIGHWYYNRETTVVGVGIGALVVPYFVDALVWPYRVF